MALRSILVSPKFLFRFESQPADGGAEHGVSHQRCRSGIAAVVLLVEQHPGRRAPGRRGEEDAPHPDVLQQQVSGCSPTRASQALVDNFAGQWLHIRNVPMHQPARNCCSTSTTTCAGVRARDGAVLRAVIIRENRSVLDLLDADYTFLNERLARHYGIPGVYGERFQRVSLPADSVRGGLLGRARF